MAKPITKWEAKNGVVFDTEAEADREDLRLAVFDAFEYNDRDEAVEIVDILRFKPEARNVLREYMDSFEGPNYRRGYFVKEKSDG